MVKPEPFGLFEVFGVELEYMIVDRETLSVKPIADRLLYDVAGDYVSDVERNSIAWSNELVNHVVELKTNGPTPLLDGLDAHFQENVREINGLLARYGAMLLPSGAHPLMDPHTETQIWPHEYNEIYSLYNRLFDCRGHGWANLQSTHLNLPFRNDAEFGRLHAAIRILLPILPALSASTPLLDGRLTGYADARLETYRHNQERIPSIAGRIIPEAVFTKADYFTRIFQPIMRDIEPYDTEKVLSHHFLNSRGAIARFDRNAIEIRVLDIQECPAADLAIVQAVVAVLKLLTAETWTSLSTQQAWSENDLFKIFLDVIRDGEHAHISNAPYLHLFGLPAAEATAGELWHHLAAYLLDFLSPDAVASLETILKHGTLSTRLVRCLGEDFTPDHIRRVYRRLAACLAANTMF